MLKINNRINKNSSSNKKAFGQIGMMMMLTIVTQIVTILKTSTVASQFGATMQMDAFNLSNSIGTFIFSFIGAGVTTVLIPKLSKDEEDKSINIFISSLYSLGFIILIVMFIFRRPIIRMITTGDEQFILIASNIMLITLLTQFINSFLGSTNAIFQCSGKFNFPKFINLTTTVILVFLIIFTKNLDIYIYASYILVTTVVNVGMQVALVVKNGYKFRFKIDIKNEEFIKMIKRFLPIALSTGVYQVSLITDTIISSNLGEGKISILSYSNTIMSMINAVLLSNLITYLYPKIAKNINDENSQERLFDLILLLNAIMCIIVVGFMLLGREGIVLLYQRGKFTSDITTVVYRCTIIYMIGLPINAIRDLIYRYFYAKGDTITPFKNSLVISVLNIIVSIILSKILGIYGIILGTVITSYISLTMILFKFNNKFGIKYNKKQMIIENGKLIIMSVLVFICFSLVNILIPNINIFIKIFAYGISILVMYGLLIYISKSKVRDVKL